MVIKINPLSVNKCWAGRRFKTPDYKSYEREVLLKLKPMVIPDGKLKLSIVFGFSSKLKDIDNPLKPFIDILQKYYGFNDRDIFKLVIEKKIVKKDSDYINFKITTL